MSESMRDKFNITQRPENERKFTAEQVADALHVSTGYIFTICTLYGIPYEVQREKNVKTALFTYEEMREIKAYVHTKKKTVEYKAPEQIAKAEEHPLVTDKRCLNLNYWPDPTPECFKGGEYD